MTCIPAILSLVIYIVLGLVCLVMAIKTLTADAWLPFHEEAAGKEWSSVDRPLQLVIMTLLRISGLGFVTTYLYLIIFPIFNFLRPVPVFKFLVPVIPFVFCLGLFLANYSLYKQSGAKTPWKGALISMILVVIAFLLSLL